MLAILDGDPQTVRLEEAHRFAHEPLDTPTGPAWDLTSLWREILAGIRQGAETARNAGADLRSIGCDTWGVDWTLVEPGGELLALPHAYRDPEHAVARDRLTARLAGGAGELYTRTGIPPQPFNTLFQVEARHAASPALFGVEGARMLLLPDLLHFLLTGVRSNERTNASTTAMLSAATGDWDRELLDSLGLPTGMLGEIVEPGSTIGQVRGSLATELGLPEEVMVVAPATHDTASAVAAAPASGEAPGTWAYLSSGTWSLLGVELDRPNTSSEAFEAGFTNEQGVGGKTRFLRNIAGLWLVQELKRDLEKRGESYDYAELADLAAASEPLRTIVDPNAEDLAAPGGSIEKLRGHAERTNQPLPESAGQLARCCLDSLACCYAESIGRIEELTDHRVEKLFLVGGGVNNWLLNQLTADATGRTLCLGPSEATALGNALVQAMGLGLASDLDALRAIVARSHPVETVAPNPQGVDWGAALRRYSSCSR